MILIVSAVSPEPPNCFTRRRDRPRRQSRAAIGSRDHLEPLGTVGRSHDSGAARQARARIVNMARSSRSPTARRGDFFVAGTRSAAGSRKRSRGTRLCRGARGRGAAPGATRSCWSARSAPIRERVFIQPGEGRSGAPCADCPTAASRCSAPHCCSASGPSSVWESASQCLSLRLRHSRSRDRCGATAPFRPPQWHGPWWQSPRKPRAARTCSSTTRWSRRWRRERTFTRSVSAAAIVKPIWGSEGGIRSGGARLGGKITAADTIAGPARQRVLHGRWTRFESAGRLPPRCIAARRSSSCHRARVRGAICSRDYGWYREIGRSGVRGLMARVGSCRVRQINLHPLLTEYRAHPSGMDIGVWGYCRRT